MKPHPAEEADSLHDELCGCDGETCFLGRALAELADAEGRRGWRNRER